MDSNYDSSISPLKVAKNIMKMPNKNLTTDNLNKSIHWTHQSHDMSITTEFSFTANSNAIQIPNYAKK